MSLADSYVILTACCNDSSTTTKKTAQLTESEKDAAPARNHIWSRNLPFRAGDRRRKSFKERSPTVIAVKETIWIAVAM